MSRSLTSPCEAARIGKRLVALGDQVFEEDPIQRASFSAGYGVTLTRLERYGEAERHLQEALAMQRAAYGRALEIQRSILGQTHSLTMDTVVNLAHLLVNQPPFSGGNA